MSLSPTVKFSLVVAHLGFAASVASASIIVDDFTNGTIAVSASNLNAPTAPVSDTDAAFLPGSNGNRSVWLNGSRGQTVFSAAGDNLQQVDSNGDGSATFLTSTSRTSSGSTKSYAYIRYGGAGTDLDLTSFTSFDVSGSGEYFRSATTLTYAFAFLTFTDTAGKTAVWKRDFQNSVAGSTLAVGDFSFDLAFTSGLPTSPVVQAGFDLSSIESLTVNFETGVTTTGSAASTWSYTATQFTLVPAPGALALLGAAGLLGGRRRR